MSKMLILAMSIFLLNTGDFLEAKRSRSYSSRSSSRSSSKSFFSRSSSTKKYSSRSTKSKYSSKKTTPKTSKYSSRATSKKSKYSSSSKPTKNIRRNSFDKKIGLKRQKKNSKLSLSKFKKSKAPTKTKTSYKTVQKNNRVVGGIVRRSSPRHIRTYHSRRTRYYVNYTPPVYAYNSYSSFGAWDAMFMWSMLDRPNYHSTYYHHMSSPGFQQWRREANRLSQDNAELRQKLNNLDRTVTGMNGTPRNDAYVPEGMDADLMLSEETVTSISRSLTSLKLATAKKGNNYYKFGMKLRSVSQAVDIDVVTTAGSMANLNLLAAGKVDAAIVQADTFKVFKKNHPTTNLASMQGSLYKEYVHILVNRRSGIKSIKDIDSSNIMHIGKGSGAEVTWNSFIIEDSYYKSVPIVYAPLNESLLNVVSNPKAVLMFVSGLKSNFLTQANAFGNKIRLVHVNDSDFDDAVDQYGNKIYHFTKIPGKTYRRLQDGVFFTHITTLGIDAVLVVSNAWKKKQGADVLEVFSEGVLETLRTF